MKYTVALIAALSIATGAAAQTVQKLSATRANDYGLTYTLPATAIDITIETETTELQPGELYKYARRYLNITDPITEASTSVTVKSVTLTTRGVASGNDRYTINFKQGYNPFMLLDAQGAPLAINTDAQYTPATVTLPVAQAAKPTPLETPAAQQALSEEIMQSQSTAKRAELVAAQIFALRQSRNDLITGQADQLPPDGKAMELILSNIDAQEAALTAMFTGTRKSYTSVSTVTYLPKKEQDEVNNYVVTRVAPERGVVAPDDLSGRPVYLSLRVTDLPEMPRNAKGEVIEIPRDALIYRIPGTALVTISFDGATMASESVEIAQYGIDYGMKASLFTDKKAPAYAVFNPVTGAIVETGSAQP